MGVVKNLMVRIGADVRGFVGGMKSASSATKQTRDSIQDSTGSIRKTIKSGFDGSRLTVRQYSQAIQQTKAAHKTAEAEAARLKDQLVGMKSGWNEASAALSGLNPAKSLNAQAAEAEEELVKIEHRRRELEKATTGVSAKKQAGAAYQKQIQELRQLAQQSRLTEATLAELNAKKELLAKNKGFDANVSLDQMRQKISQTEAQLNAAQLAAAKTGDKLKDMGTVEGFAVDRVLKDALRAVSNLGKAAGNAAAVGMKAMYTGLKKLGGVALRGTVNAIRSIGTAASRAAVGGVRLLSTGMKRVGTAAVHAAGNGVKMLHNGIKALVSGSLDGLSRVAGKLLGIGRQAHSGTGGLKNMVRQIRNIGAVSLSLRLVSGVFGRLRSLISSYISSNEELNASVALLKNQLGQALEPAIRLVIAAMQELVPLAQKVSSAINAVLKALIGDIGDVQYAFRNLGTYGFDQITKADDEEEEETTEQEQSTLVQKLTAWIEELKAAFTSGNWEQLGALIGDGINAAFASIDVSGVGQKVAEIVDNVAVVISSAFEALDMGSLGAGLAQAIATALTGMDAETLGQIIGQVFTALPEIAVGFITGADWAPVTGALSTCILTALTLGNDWLSGVDWQAVGDSLRDGITGIDWSGISAELSKLLGNTLGALNFGDLGALIATAFNGALDGADWSTLGQALGNVLLALPQMVAGFAEELNWGALANAVSSGLRSGLEQATEWIRTTDWVKIGQGITAFIEATDWGGIASDFFTLLSAAFFAIDFTSIGANVSAVLNDVMADVDWNEVGRTIGRALTALPDVLIGFILATDWAAVGKSVSDMLNNALVGMTEWIRSTDWVKVGQSTTTFIEATDWGTIASNFFTLLSAAFFAIDFTSIGANVSAMLNDVMADVDWNEVGRTIGRALTALPDVLVGFILETDWQKVGDSLSELIIGTLDYITQWFKETDFLEIGKSVQTFIEATNWDGIAQSLHDLFAAAVTDTDYTDLGGAVIDLLNAAIENAQWGKVGATAATLFNGVLEGLDTVLTEFNWDGMIAGLTQELNGLVNGVDWEKLGTTVSDGTVTILSGIGTAISEFNWLSLGSGIAQSINALDWANIASELGSGLSDAAIGALDLLIGFVEELDWGNLATELMNFGRNALDDVDWSGLVKRCFELLGSAIGGLTSFIAGRWTAVFDTIMDAAGDVGAYFEEWITACGGDVISGFLLGIAVGVANIYNWIKENIVDPFLEGFKEAFGIHSPSTLMKEQGGFITDGMFEGIKEKFAGVKTWVTNNLWTPFKKAIEDTFSQIGDKLGKIFEKIPDGIKKPINTVLGFINSMIKGVCDGVNTIIEALNAISIEVPDWAIFGDMRGKTFGFDIPKITAPTIPLLAEGGIVDGPTQLIAGEKGKEAIVPLENNTEWIDKVADKVSTRVSGGGGGNQPMIVQVFLGKRKLTEYVIQDINQITKSTGVCPIHV